MRITAYASAILETMGTSPYLESRAIHLDERPPDSGYLKGSVTFVDGSALNFKEYVIFKHSGAVVIKYGYHYLSNTDELIFRYDNALDPATRTLSTWPEHKHTPEGLFPAARPSFVDLLAEINEIIERSVS